MKHAKIIKIIVIIFGIGSLLLPSTLTPIFGNHYIYIIKPMIWILLSLSTYFLLPKEIQKYNFNAKDIRQLALIGSLIYIIIYFLSGMIIGYSKSPFDRSLIGIIKNIWYIGCIVITQEFVRDAFFKTTTEKNKYYVLVFITVFLTLAEIGLPNMIDAFSSYSNIFSFIVKYFIPISIINIFLSYLVYRDGVKAALLFKLPYSLLYIFTPVFPQSTYSVLLIVQTIVPLLIYLKIESVYYHNFAYGIKIKEKPMKKIYRFSGIAFLITLILFLLKFLPIYPIVIATNSMHPSIKRGDIVIGYKTNFNSIKAGDIIEYDLDKTPIIHRVKETEKIYSIGEVLITKGDNNKKPDLKPVTKKQFHGKIVSIIPKLGYPTLFFREIIEGKRVDINIEVSEVNEN